MTDPTRAAPVLTTGRPLDDRDDPKPGPALELDRDGPSARLLRESPHALVSSPGADTWATLLERPTDGATGRCGPAVDHDRPVLAQWLGPDAPEPPAHVHPTTETFEAVEGTLTVEVDGRTRRLSAGESATVDAGVEHTFRNATDGTVAFRAEMPSMRTVASLYTVWALDHEGAFGGDGEYGQPGLLHALPVSEDVYPDTETTIAPVTVQRALWATVGRLARSVGYTGIDEAYLADAFWERRVEQPPR
ncbi:cupin domain-containing protein [Halosimplex sp. J119]